MPDARTRPDGWLILGGILGGIAFCLVMLTGLPGRAAVAGGLTFTLTWVAVAALLPSLRRRASIVRRQREGYFGRDDRP